MNKKRIDNNSVSSILGRIFLLSSGLRSVGNGNNGNITATMTVPNGSIIKNLTITPEPSSPDVYPPPTINFWLEPSPGGGCVNCAVGMFNLKSEGQTYKGYQCWGSSSPIPNELVMCAHEKGILNDFTHHVKDCIYLLPSK